MCYSNHENLCLVGKAYGATHSNGNNAFVAKVRWSRTLRPKPKVSAVPPRAEPIAVPDWTRIGDADSGLSVGVPFD